MPASTNVKDQSGGSATAAAAAFEKCCSRRGIGQRPRGADSVWDRETGFPIPKPRMERSFDRAVWFRSTAEPAIERAMDHRLPELQGKGGQPAKPPPAAYGAWWTAHQRSGLTRLTIALRVRFGT